MLVIAQENVEIKHDSKISFLKKGESIEILNLDPASNNLIQLLNANKIELYDTDFENYSFDNGIPEAKVDLTVTEKDNFFKNIRLKKSQ